MVLRELFGRDPELLEERGGRYIPNNNQLAWGQDYKLEACLSALEAIAVSENYYLKQAA